MIIDIVLVVIILIFALVGLIRGFVTSLFKFFKGTTGMVVATLVAKPFSMLFASLKVTNLISKILYSLKLGNALIAEETFNEILAASENATVTGDMLYSSVSGKGSFLLKTFFAKMFSSEAVYASYEDVATKFTYGFASIIVIVISFILAFILIKLILGLINKIFTNEAGARRFGPFDRVFGMIFGLLKACGFIILVVFAINTLSIFPVVGTAVENIINGTKLTATIYSWITKLFVVVVKNINFNELITGILN